MRADETHVLLMELMEAKEVVVVAVVAVENDLGYSSSNNAKIKKVILTTI